MYDYINPTKVLNALNWLKINNVLYKDVTINPNWVESSIVDNDITCSLMPQTISSETCETCDDDSCLDNSDSHSDLFGGLSQIAKHHGFIVHDVPADGDCLFSAIACQLESIGIDNINKDALRHQVVSYLAENSTRFRDYVSQPVLSTNPCNADTEPPTIEDDYIATVSDPDLQTELRWQRYLKRLLNGAWGDHVALQGLCEMLNISAHILSTQNPVMVDIVPSTGNSVGDVHIGLIEQYHFVALKKSFPNYDRANNNQNETQRSLSDDVIDKGDEHNRQITGGPSDSMLFNENPQIDSQIYSVAPGEGQKPLSMTSDENFEELFNPDKFCLGVGGFNTKRPRRIVHRRYFNQRLLDVDGRFARDIDYLFVSQYIIESQQIRSCANHYVFRRKPCTQLTASQARDPNLVNEHINKDMAYKFMQNVRGSPPYYQRTFYDLLAMIRQLGTPTWFLTLSSADMKWPDFIQIIAKQHGVEYTDDDVLAMSFEEKSKWLRSNPVTAARHFQYRLNSFFNDFLKSSAKPLGEIVDYAIRIEFQSRGSPHAHTVIWVKDAPKFGVDDDQVVCDFIDKYITCSIPTEDGRLRDLVELLQQHKHSSYCRRNKKCRFNFPQPPTNYTLISKHHSDANDKEHSRLLNILCKVRKALVDGDASHNDLMGLLASANVSYSDYCAALAISKRGRKVLLKRLPNECNVNNYNKAVMLAWQANMDLQYIIDPYACVMYVASYIMKAERSMGELLKKVSNEVRTDDLIVQLRKVGSAFLTHREVSAQEAVYRILSMPLKQLSRGIVFISTNPKNERIAVLKKKDMLNNLHDDDTNIFCTNLIDRYQHRPQPLNSMCLAEFAATYVTNYRADDDDVCDALPETEHDTVHSNEIKLTGGYGTMKKRQRKAVIRFKKYNKETEPSKYYRSKIMLYLPWYNEDVDLLGGYCTYEEHYRNVHSIICTNEQIYTVNKVGDLDIDINGPYEHLWDGIAPNTEDQRLSHDQQGSELITDVEQEDLVDNEIIMNGTTSAGSLALRFESCDNQLEIPANDYRNLFRQLNKKQKIIVRYHRQWCKNAVIALKAGKSIQPYQVFLSGPGGVGKSHVIRMIHSDTIKFLKLSGAFEPDEIVVLLSAPTGVAAFNINGMTLHSAFLLSIRGSSSFLSSDRLNTLRTKLSGLQLLIVDEISMVGSNMLLEIHKRLCQIKGVAANVPFGGVSVLAVGDLYQLPPVLQSPLFSTVRDCYASLYGSGSMWKDEFQIFELDEVMRQRGDDQFAQLLCRVRVNACTEDDVDVLRSRVIKQDDPNYPIHALHVYRVNKDVDTRNKVMLNSIASEDQQYIIKSIDTISGQTSHIQLSKLSDKRSETGGLHGTLTLAIGARVMLTANVDVKDGLVNGAIGEVVHIVTDSDNAVTKVLVKFDNPSVGRNASQCSPYHLMYDNAVVINRHEAVFLAQGKKGSEVTRVQFPLTLSWATTIHKVQGVTLDEIVVDMSGRFSSGQAYVALSRVKRLAGLHILNFNAGAIKTSDAVHEEMTRLNTKTLKFSTELHCAQYFDSHFTIVLLNIRSLKAKMTDILSDTCLNNAKALCLCESWLSSGDVIPSLRDNHVTFRCDRSLNNHKGGVLISVVQEAAQPSCTISYQLEGIECIVTKMLLPNVSNLFVVLIYRAPNCPIDRLIDLFINKLQDVLNSSLPTVILGDFNVNLLNNQTSNLSNLLYSCGYKQLVSTPTTDSGTLIDHIYFNGHCDNVVTQVIDTYYSDHDSVYCSIPL
jgi:hypothetical protein